MTVIQGVYTQVGQPDTLLPIKVNSSGEIITSGGGGGGGGGLTNAELRASPVPVSGPLTDSQLRASGIPLAPSGYLSSVSITRPANTTAYTANDVVGGLLTISNVGPNDGHLIITSCDLRYDISAIPSGMTSFRLHLYSSSPASNYADNAAWDLPSGDRSAYIGFIDLGTLLDLGSTCFTQVDIINKHVKLVSSSNLFGYIVTNAGYTPAANSETLRLNVRGVTP